MLLVDGVSNGSDERENTIAPNPAHAGADRILARGERHGRELGVGMVIRTVLFGESR
jgi:hypothetical protein